MIRNGTLFFPKCTAQKLQSMLLQDRKGYGLGEPGVGFIIKDKQNGWPHNHELGKVADALKIQRILLLLGVLN